MLKISNDSLCHVLHSLRGKNPPSTLDSLRRTCKRINNQACSMGFDKLEDVCLTLSSIFDHSYLAWEELGQTGFSLTTSIGFKELCYYPNCDNCFYHRIRLRPDPIINRPIVARPVEEAPQEKYQSEVCFSELPERRTSPPDKRFPEIYLDTFTMDRRYPWDSESVLNDDKPECQHGSAVNNFTTKTVLRAERPSGDHFYNKFAAALKRIRSIGVLKLSGWLIEKNIMQYLINCTELTSLHEVHFVNCVVTITKEEFLAFLKSRPIREIHLNSKFKKFSMDDSCLMNIPRVFFSGCNESLFYFGYTGITDNLLNNWIATPPVQIDFLSVKSNITVYGIINLLKASLASNSSSEYQLSEMYATRKEFGILHKATKEIRGANWQFRKYGGQARVMITSKTNNNFEISFDLWIKKTPLQ